MMGNQYEYLESGSVDLRTMHDAGQSQRGVRWASETAAKASHEVRDVVAARELHERYAGNQHCSVKRDSTY
jgi:hypothetical protein